MNSAMPPRSHRYPIGTILFLLFVTFTLLEIFLIFQLAEWTSWPITILIAIGSAILGSIMAKREGLAVVKRAQAELQTGRFPARPLADGVMILLGGALLITPGLITDVIGFTTLIPFCRRAYASVLIKWARRNLNVVKIGPGFGAHAGFGGPHVHDATPGSYRSTTQGESDASERVTVRSKPVGEDDAIDVEFKRVD